VSVTIEIVLWFSVAEQNVIGSAEIRKDSFTLAQIPKIS
jgi:hypothetical protein